MITQEWDVLHESNVFQLSVLEAERSLLVKWRDITDFEQWEKANSILYKALTTHEVKAYVFDIRQSTPLSQVQLEHLVTTLVPQHYAAGLRAIVYVSPEDFNLEMIAQTFLNRIQKTGIAQTQHRTLADASDWLRQTLSETQ